MHCNKDTVSIASGVLTLLLVLSYDHVAKLIACSALILLTVCQEEHPTCKN